MANIKVRNNIVQSLRPSIRHYWRAFLILAFSMYLAYAKFDIHTITGLSILSVSGFLTVYIIASVYTTKYLITPEGILIRRGPFALKFTEISYNDINSILIKQGSMQKQFKIGNLTIHAEHIQRVFRGIKNPYKIKELISREKASYCERRTLLRRML